MTLRIFVLAGGGNSGKSRTLRSLRAQLGGSRRRPGRFRGRPVHIEYSSPQELCGGCHDTEDAKCVIEFLERWIEETESERASLLVLPFTMKYNKDDGRFNERCIRTPLGGLRRSAHQVHLVYLRKRQRSPLRLRDMDRLMSSLRRELRIVSRKDEEDRQARELLRFIRRVA